MKAHTTSGIITMKDHLGITYSICRLDYTLCENGNFQYVFTPDYRIIDILPKEFQGIPGIDLSLHREQYIRKNITPVFISERTPPENRADLWDLLDEVNMDHLNKVEWLLRTKKRYLGDNLRLMEVPKSLDPASYGNESQSSTRLCSSILKSIAEGRDVTVGELKIVDSNRSAICSILRTILESDSLHRSEQSKIKGTKSGRKTIEIGEIDLETMISHIEKKIITIDDAAKKLGVSRATLYRRIKDRKDRQNQ